MDTQANPVVVVSRVVLRAVKNSVLARIGPYRSWPDTSMLLDSPLAMAEERTSRLRRIYDNAGRDSWDGAKVFREAMEKHGGIQLEREKREALAYLVTGLMWGELAAWIIAAELTERIEDPDARMAASSQVFDEARHFYVMRDYVAALHVPIPPLEPYYAIAFRRLLSAKDLVVKLFAMQILAEGAAVVIFRFLHESQIEPVLSDILPLVERDESRHVGLGVLYLPGELEKLPQKKLMRIRSATYGIGDLFGAAQIRNAKHFATLGIDPRDLIRSADKMLFELSEKIGPIPGTDLRFFPVNPTTSPDYERNLDYVLPREGQPPPPGGRLLRRIIDHGLTIRPKIGRTRPS